MKWTHVIWDYSPDGTVEHIAEHALSQEDVEHVLEHFSSQGMSRSSGRPCVFGHTPDGCHIIVIYEEPDEHTIVPVSAYRVPERGEP